MRSVISKLTGSVMMRLAIIFGALATMTGTAITIGWLVFQSIATNMATFSEQSLPSLQISAEVVASTDQTRSVLAEVLIAPDKESIPDARAGTTTAIESLQNSISSLPEDERSSIQPLVQEVSVALESLIVAREAEFASNLSVSEAVEAAQILATEAGALLEEASDNAYFDLVIGGDDTIQSIGETLSQLVERDFELYQSTLSVKSEMNLLSGMVLSRSQSRDTALISILDDLADGANNRLQTMLDTVQSFPATEQLAKDVEKARAELLDRARPVSPSSVLSIRQQTDASLSSVLDDISFELVIQSEEAKSQNEVSVRKLLDEQVAQIREQAKVALATRGFFASVMQVALARNEVELSAKADALRVSKLNLEEALQSQGSDIREKLQAILAIADNENGIEPTRRAAFEANDNASKAARDATNAVQKIAVRVSDFALFTREQISNTSKELTLEVVHARSQMQQIGVASVFIIAIAPILIWIMVTRPLNRVTRTTERLANGDLSEITGLAKNRGEIGRMATALKVFRQGAIERIQMQEDEKKREAEAYEAKRQAEEAKQKEIEERRLEASRKEEEKRLSIAAEAAREQQNRDALDQERKVRAKEQELVVSELAQSLKLLSGGDLTHYIQMVFPGGYEELRQDYNAAIKNLSEMIRRIGESSQTVDLSTSEIAASSLELARRTENSAETLEKTADSLNDLTKSVSSTASGASVAKKAVDSVKSNADSGYGVMREAVDAMGQIEKSSSKISGVVEVIDAIAFQTNLLALNAGVEAARAGDAGRGFAVVATEVRMLAQRCSEAALEINQLVSNSSTEVERGVTMIDRTNSALKSIIDGISDASRHVANIESAAIEQSTGIEELNSAVAQLDRATQQNAAMFEETTAASQALTSEAQSLSQIVGSFEISPSSDSKEDSDVRRAVG